MADEYPSGEMPTSRTHHACAGILLAAFGAFALGTLRTTAPTSDEVPHLVAGYAHLTTGAPLLNPEHPPLVKILAALPLLPTAGSLEEIGREWRDLDEWELGRRFLFSEGRNTSRIMSTARLPMIALGLLLCSVCYLWSLRLHGPAGGITSLALAALCPTLLAHARLVTTDVPAGAFGVLAAWCLWEWSLRPSWKGIVATGLSLGACFASKFSGVVIAGALLLSAIVFHMVRRRDRESVRSRPETGVARLSDRAPGVGRRTGAASLTRAAILVATVASLVVACSYSWPPSLDAYSDGIGQVGFNHRPGYEFYLLGEYREGGFPSYFPIAFLLKSSPAFLVALALLLVLALREGSGRLRRSGRLRSRGEKTPPGGFEAEAASDTPQSSSQGPVWPFLWIPAAVYVAFVMLTAPNIGVRYLIPVYPFVMIALGGVGATLWPSRRGKALLGILLATHIHAAASAWPDPLSYFNGLFGCRGPEAIACLDDSNIDWGQDLGRAAEVVRDLQRPGDVINLLYTGSADPGAYFTSWRPLPSGDYIEPRPQLYVMSLHRLNAIPHETGRSSEVDWRERFKPASVVGNTYFIYDFRGGGQTVQEDEPHDE